MADDQTFTPSPAKPRRRWLLWLLAVLVLLGVGGFLVYRQALATEAVALLDTADRVLRGGGWCIVAVGCRSASRTFNSPGNRSFCYGFRVVSPQ